MSKQAIPGAKRGTIFYVDPYRVTIIGRDTTHGAGDHPLYDERALRDPDETRVRNIRTYGVKETVKVRKNGRDEDGQDVLEVIDGRGRTIDCREAYDRAEKAGEEPPLLKVEIERSDEDTQVGIMISMNEQRAEDTPMNRARKAVRVLAMNRSVDDVANMFGVTTKTIDNWRKLVTLSKKVQKAIDQGKIAASAALPLIKLSHQGQDEKLSELLEDAKENGKKPTARNTKSKLDPEVRARPFRLTKSVAIKLVEREDFVEELSPDAHALLRFIGGDPEAVKDVPGLEGLIEELL